MKKFEVFYPYLVPVSVIIGCVFLFQNYADFTAQKLTELDPGLTVVKQAIHDPAVVQFFAGVSFSWFMLGIAISSLAVILSRLFDSLVLQRGPSSFGGKND